MIREVIRRSVFTVLILVGVAVIVSFALSFVPDQTADATVLERWRGHLYTVLTFSYGGEDGIIASQNRALSTILWGGGLITFKLIGGGLLLVLIVGIPLGVGRALRPESRSLWGVASLAHAFSSIPILVWAFGLLVSSTALFGVAPRFSNLQGAGLWESVLIYAVPISALAFGDGIMSDVIRHVRREAEHELDQTFIRALRARQVSVSRHLFRGVVGPVFSVISNKISYLISGTIVVEYVFGARGLAYQIYSSIMSNPKGYDVILSATLLFVGLTVLLNILTEVVALVADPRLRKA